MIATIVLPLMSLAAATAASPGCGPERYECKAAPGNFTISQYELYPENLDFDRKRCVTYLSSLWNGTFSTYDVREKKITAITPIPIAFGNPLLHTGGLQVDIPHDRLSIVNDFGATFDTGGENINGSCFATQYNLATKKFEWTVNLTVATNGVYSGYQDVDHDYNGNLFVVGTFPSSIIKVSGDGKHVQPWYLDPNKNHTLQGFTGIAAINNGHNFLVSDNTGGKILRFDAHDTEGKPFHISLQKGAEPIGGHLDGAYVPTLFKGTVLLVSDNFLGTIVIQSKDGKWNTAEKVGVIPNAFLSEGGSTTAAVEMGGRIYVSTMYFGDEPRNRTTFPYYDILDDILEFL